METTLIWVTAKRDFVKMGIIVIGYLNTFSVVSKPFADIYSFPLSAKHLLKTFMMICSIIEVIHNIFSLFFSLKCLSFFAFWVTQITFEKLYIGIHHNIYLKFFSLQKRSINENEGEKKVIKCKQIRAYYSYCEDFLPWFINLYIGEGEKDKYFQPPWERLTHRSKCSEVPFGFLWN